MFNRLFFVIIFSFFLSFSFASSNDISIAFDYQKTTPLLHPPYISAAINDATDPAFNKGFFVNVSHNGKPVFSNDYLVKIESNNPLVVANNDVIITKNNGDFNVKIKPSGVGYANIVLSVIKGKDTETITINYAASSSNKNLQTLYFTGFSDASAAISLDDDYMLVGDDESNVLSVYSIHQSGLPIKVFNYETNLCLSNETTTEVDCELAARSLKHNNLVYWSGSMGNGGKKFVEKENRSTLFCTSLSGKGKEVSIEYKGCYSELRKHLIKWGNSNGYNFSASSAAGEKPKQINGFNVEGMVFAPDSTTLYIAFRAPLVPISDRKKALIAPIKNFEEWFEKGHHAKELIIEKPIELDLGGRAFRDIIRLSNSQYLIVAGNSTAEKNAATYLWSGFAADLPMMIKNDEIKDFNLEAAIEITNSGNYTGKVQLLCDDGATDFYNDGVSSKHLNDGFKKFRSIIISLK
jgi:hypothetical protein